MRTPDEKKIQDLAHQLGRLVKSRTHHEEQMKTINVEIQTVRQQMHQITDAFSTGSTSKPFGETNPEFLLKVEDDKGNVAIGVKNPNYLEKLEHA